MTQKFCIVVAKCERVGYAISLASIAIAKESLFGIAKGSVNGTLLQKSADIVDSLLSCLPCLSDMM